MQTAFNITEFNTYVSGPVCGMATVGIVGSVAFDRTSAPSQRCIQDNAIASALVVWSPSCVYDTHSSLVLVVVLRCI